MALFYCLTRSIFQASLICCILICSVLQDAKIQTVSLSFLIFQFPIGFTQWKIPEVNKRARRERAQNIDDFFFLSWCAIRQMFLLTDADQGPYSKLYFCHITFLLIIFGLVICHWMDVSLFLVGSLIAVHSLAQNSFLQLNTLNTYNIFLDELNIRQEQKYVIKIFL